MTEATLVAPPQSSVDLLLEADLIRFDLSEAFRCHRMDLCMLTLPTQCNYSIESGQ